MFGQWLVPLTTYFVVFCLLTYPAITLFSTHFMSDAGDGLQNVWNMWWVNKSVTELHQLPWHTTWLHYPHGTTLLIQTLNPFNGFVGIPLQTVFSLTQSFNIMVIFGFVFGATTAFWLCFHVTRDYFCSLVGGFIFSFSNYHFAHAEGHLQLVSLQFIPLFVLFWLRLLEKPNYRTSACAAITLFLVILCDYYYFFFCVLAGALMTFTHAFYEKEPFFVLKREYLRPLILFTVLALTTSGVLAGALVWNNHIDPVVYGAHPAKIYSMDLLALLIPGGHWFFAPLTEWYWSKLPGNIHESSVHLGSGVFVLLILAGLWSAKAPGRLGYWWVLILFFFAMALGPVFTIFGSWYEGVPMPYSAMTTVLPILDLGGAPVRMVIMVILASSVLCAESLRQLRASRARIAAPLLLGIIVFEFLPKPIPTTRVQTPAYVDFLEMQTGLQPIIDSAPASAALYYQTIHEQPMAFGYVSRLTQSTLSGSTEVSDLLNRGDTKTLYEDFGFRFFIQEEGDKHRIYDLSKRSARPD
ncbi:MAG: hypothetical protein AAGI03_02645 [Pseudomonadota bacterium]